MHSLSRFFFGKHINGFGLINMFRPMGEHEQELRVTFGRVYDPKLGRFLSPDPILQDAGNTQNLNRYSYVLNNPLKYTDPSGYTYRAQAVTFKGRENPDGSYGNFAGFDGGGGSVFQKMGVLNGEAGPVFEDLYFEGPTGNWVRRSDLQKDVVARYVSKDAYVSVGSQSYYKGSSLHLEKLNISNTDWWYRLSTTITGLGAIISTSGDTMDGVLNWLKRINNSEFQLWLEKAGLGATDYSDEILKATKINNIIKGASRVLFAFGTAMSVTEFAINPTVEQGAMSTTDIGFGAIGLSPMWPISLLYYGDKAVQGISPAYKREVDIGLRLHNYERQIVTSPENWYYSPGPCFIAGTKVLLSTGNFKNIEDISIGDTVATYNTQNLEVENGLVRKVLRHVVTEIYCLNVDDFKFYVTGEHPFYVIDKGWIKVLDLRMDDLLLTHEGNKIKATSIQKITKSIEVFNIHVDGNHNYYVGEAKVLVHNK